MGGLLVALAAVGVFSAYRGASKQPSTRYVVVARDLAAGTILSPADLSTELVDLPGAVAGRAFTDPGTLVGRITIGPLREGELVQGSVVIDQSRVGTTYQVSLPVERSRALAGGLIAGQEHLAATTGASPSEREVTRYWRALIEANRASLPDPLNPDLLFAAAVLVLPPV